MSYLPINTSYSTPASAATLTVPTGRNVVMAINPAATIASLTVNLPAAPMDGDRVTLSSTQIITTLTVGVGTIVGTLAALGLAGFATFQYNATAGVWFRVG